MAFDLSALLGMLGSTGRSTWGAARPYVTDPMAWLGAAGTGAGIYDIIRRQRAEKDYLRRQRDWQGRVESIANAPLNVEAIFNPAKALIQRDLEAGLAERGLQPGGAYAGAMGEGMMRQYLNAAQIAQAQRGNQLSALTGAGPVRPEFPGVGDTSALGKYLQYVNQSKAATAARGQQKDFQSQILDIIRSAKQPGGAPGRSQNFDTYAGSYDDMTEGPYPGWAE
jgi:hypothetical protein